MLHAGQPERVFTALDAIAHALGDEERWEAAVLRGAALVALGRLDHGIATLRPALGSGTERVRNEARCELAEAYLRAGRLDDAETVLSPFLDGEGEGEPHRAGGLALYGRMERARGRSVVAGRYFLDALAALEHLEEPHYRLRNALLHDVAVVAVETLEPRLFERVRARLATVDGLGAEHVAIQRARVRGELLCGETERAWDIAFATFVSSPPGIARVGASLGLALTARAGGERFTPARLTLAATDEGDHADWAQAGAEDRLVLLRLVGALAPLAGARACALLRAYEMLPPAGVEAIDDPVALALARADLAQGTPAERRTLLEHAVRSARTAGNAWAEAEAVLALASDGDEAALRRADELTRLAPRSWLRRRCEALERSRGPARLSPAERRVMYAICEGRSTADIAARFGRSKNTIRNQTRRVYEVMEVRTRSALVAKCAAAGLLSSAPTPVVSKA
jgi:DNA-binding CsgD family transcriptional regulator